MKFKYLEVKQNLLVYLVDLFVLKHLQVFQNFRIGDKDTLGVRVVEVARFGGKTKLARSVGEVVCFGKCSGFPNILEKKCPQG